eukprot:scaffold4358_cov137-Isochrysis_galbana.AAC.10
MESRYKIERDGGSRRQAALSGLCCAGLARARRTQVPSPNIEQLARSMVSAKPQLASGTCEAAAGPDELRLGSAARRGTIRCAGLRCTHLLGEKSQQPLRVPRRQSAIGRC